MISIGMRWSCATSRWLRRKIQRCTPAAWHEPNSCFIKPFMLFRRFGIEPCHESQTVILLWVGTLQMRTRVTQIDVWTQKNREKYSRNSFKQSFDSWSIRTDLDRVLNSIQIKEEPKNKTNAFRFPFQLIFGNRKCFLLCCSDLRRFQNEQIWKWNTRERFERTWELGCPCDECRLTIAHYIGDTDIRIGSSSLCQDIVSKRTYRTCAYMPSRRMRFSIRMSEPQIAGAWFK